MTYAIPDKALKRCMWPLIKMLVACWPLVRWVCLSWDACYLWETDVTLYEMHVTFNEMCDLCWDVCYLLCDACYLKGKLCLWSVCYLWKMHECYLWCVACYLYCDGLYVFLPFMWWFICPVWISLDFVESSGVVSNLCVCPCVCLTLCLSICLSCDVTAPPALQFSTKQGTKCPLLRLVTILSSKDHSKIKK